MALTHIVMITRRQVLRYGQLELDYFRPFGLSILENLVMVELDARIIKALTLKYNPESKKPNIAFPFPRERDEFMCLC